MSHDSERADAPSQWLLNARADLSLARVKLPQEGLYEHLCFHAEQAAEKSLKAILLKYRIDFPFTHNLQILLDLLPKEINVPKEILKAVELNPYAISTRYPGTTEPVTEQEYRESILIAEAVLKWAEFIIGGFER
jgi:HEPN domain-containing protein